MNRVDIQDLVVAYGETVAVQSVSFEIAPGEVHVLLGHSGSGKTTILRALAGFERARSGELVIEGATVDGSGWVPPERRPVGLVFQDYALFPHMTVARNVAFGLAKSADAASEVGRLLDLIGLADRAEAMPGELSGGEQQRVALARALARKPSLLLMDEPFSNLDPQLRSAVRAQTFDLVRELGISTLLVTHTAEEAMEVGDRISVLRGGHLLQTGTAQKLYREPATMEVATALGSANLVEAEVAEGVIRCVFGELSSEIVSGAPASGRGNLVIRPEDIACDESGGCEVNVVNTTFLGERVVHHFEREGQMLRLSCASWAEPLHDSIHVTIRRAHWVD